jgi:aminoglycoside phosphotransferase (APT) family kinase protein
VVTKEPKPGQTHPDWRLRVSSRDPTSLLAGLTDWFSHTMGVESRPRLTSFGSPGKAGMSSETLLFDLDWEENGVARHGAFVLRLPPPEDSFPIFPEYNLDLQVDAMRLVSRGGTVPVPRIPWQERNSKALGAPFFIMERIDGAMVPDNPPYIFGGWLADATPAQQIRVQRELVTILTGVHNVNASLVERNFLEIDRPGASPLCRHFARERTLYEWGRNSMHFPLVEALFDWLAAHWPRVESPAVVIWGDARPGNVLWRDFHATAVLDWELATIGPREMDVGYLIFFHQYFRHVARVVAGRDPMPQFLRRNDVVNTYQEIAETKLTDIDWFITYGLLQQAVVEIRLSQRRILFGEMERPADTNDYLYSRRMIEQILADGPGIWQR